MDCATFLRLPTWVSWVTAHVDCRRKWGIGDFRVPSTLWLFGSLWELGGRLALTVWCQDTERYSGKSFRLWVFLEWLVCTGSRNSNGTMAVNISTITVTSGTVVVQRSLNLFLWQLH